MKTDEVVSLRYCQRGLEDDPVSDTIIWRYLDLPRFGSMLKRNALYFPVLAALDDDFEGAAPTPPQATQQDKDDHWYQWRSVRAKHS